MKDQKVFCVLSGLGILSNNKNTAFGMQLKFFAPNWFNTDFRPGCLGLYPVGCWKSPRTQVPWSFWTACCNLLSQWNTSFVYSAGTSLIWISCCAPQQESWLNTLCNLLFGTEWKRLCSSERCTNRLPKLIQQMTCLIVYFSSEALPLFSSFLL